MTLQDVIDPHGILIDPTTLVIQRWLPGPVDRVWRYLTQGDLRRQWLAAGEMELSPGAPFEFVWRNDDLSRAPDARAEGVPEVSRLQSRVISVTPPHELKIAWDEGDVTFVLEERGHRVLLTLTHTGLHDRPTRTGVAAGWHTHLDILVAVAGGGQGPSFWQTWRGLRADYDAQLPQ